MGKSYKASRDEQEGEPVTFDIEGVGFSIPTPLPGFVLLDFAELEDADGGQAVKAFAAFYRQCFRDDKAQYKRFRDVCTKYAVPLKVDMENGDMGDDELSLLAVASDIIAEATGRPTTQRSDSSEAPLATGTSSDTDA
jgi:hypothetical protein